MKGGVDPEEGVWVAVFDIALLREYREHQPWGNAYRKQGRYGKLLNDTVEEPFQRKDARR